MAEFKKKSTGEETGIEIKTLTNPLANINTLYRTSSGVHEQIWMNSALQYSQEIGARVDPKVKISKFFKGEKKWRFLDEKSS